MSAAESHAVSRDFAGTIEAAEEAEMWIASEAGSLGLGPNAEFAVTLCLEELFLNAVKHGGVNRTTISVIVGSDGVTLEFVDDGAAFDPTSAPACRISGRTEDFQIGGYGAGLLHKFSRSMSYCRSGSTNCVVLEFDADRNASASTKPGSEALRAT